MIGDEIFARYRLYRLLGRAYTVGVAAIKPIGEEPRSECARAAALELQPRQSLLAQEIHFLGREGGADDYVADELERQFGVRGQRVRPYGEEIGAGARRDAAANRFDGFSDLIGCSIPRTLRQQAGHHVGKTGLVRGIVIRARRNGQ